MDKVFNNPAGEVSFEEPAIVSIGSIKTINGSSYVKMQYSCYLAMRLTEDDAEKRDTALVIKGLQDQYGKGNVTYDAATGTYRLFAIENVIANSIDKRRWTFVTVKEEQKQLLARFIPKELL